jgi:hypothetical protein
MLAFRSEEHVDAWCELRRLGRGAVFSMDQCWRLAEAWFADRLQESWRRRTRDEAQALFSELGLEGSFWRLP